MNELNKAIEEEQKRIITNAQNCEDIVKELLLKDVRCRNDDLWLILQVWQNKQHIKITIQPDMIGELISPETIRRSRQKIQNSMCLFPPTDPRVAIKRKIKEVTLRKYYSPSDWEEYNSIRFGIK